VLTRNNASPVGRLSPRTLVFSLFLFVSVAAIAALTVPRAQRSAVLGAVAGLTAILSAFSPTLGEIDRKVQRWAVKASLLFLGVSLGVLVQMIASSVMR
jgi:hypothetical protein